MIRRDIFKLALGAAVMAAVPRSVLAMADEALPTVYADGVNCDAAGVSALIRGDAVRMSAAAAKVVRRFDGGVDFGGLSVSVRETIRIVIDHPTHLSNLHVSNMEVFAGPLMIIDQTKGSPA